MQINFTKMQGTGNDMIMIDNRNKNINLNSNQVKSLCNRQFGIGADGLILLELSENADCFMNYYNADGSIGEMCGNGVRCTAKFFQEVTNSKKDTITIDTRAGIKTIQISQSGYIVNMGKPLFTHQDFPSKSVSIENLNWHFASMGNPHAVAVSNQDPYQIDLEKIGPIIENHTSLFKNKINVEIVQVKDKHNLIMRVWERGSGITLACGTGACAVFAVCHKLNLIDSSTTIQLPGGNLKISYNQNLEILMDGPAENVFTGTINI
jgi:diaminopimelate epimerase